MSQWLEDGLKGKGVKSVLRLYFYTVLILVPIATVAVLALGDEQAFKILPLLVVVVVCVQHFINHRSKKSVVFKKKVTVHDPPSTGTYQKRTHSVWNLVTDFAPLVLAFCFCGVLSFLVARFQIWTSPIGDAPRLPMSDVRPSFNAAAGNKAANTSMTSTSGDKIGVPECDEYIAKVEACLAKVPAAGQPAVKSSLDAMRKSWRDAAATPQGKAGLAAGCKQALETAKTTFSAYGCGW